MRCKQSAGQHKILCAELGRWALHDACSVRQHVFCNHVTSSLLVTPRGQEIHQGRCWAPHVGFMENEHGDYYTRRLMGIAACGGDTDKDTRRSRRTAENKQGVKRRTEHNTLSQRQNTFTWTADNRRAQNNRKRTKNCACSSTKHFRADSWTRTAVHGQRNSTHQQLGTSNSERKGWTLAKTLYEQQFNIRKQQQQACYSIKYCEIKPHRHTTIMASRQSAYREKRQSMEQGCHRVWTERTAVTTKQTRPTESTIRKRKILPHTIDTQILEFYVLHKMWELKRWLNESKPVLRDKRALRRNTTGRDVTYGCVERQDNQTAGPVHIGERQRTRCDTQHSVKCKQVHAVKGTA